VRESDVNAERPVTTTKMVDDDVNARGFGRADRCDRDRWGGSIVNPNVTPDAIFESLLVFGVSRPCVSIFLSNDGTAYRRVLWRWYDRERSANTEGVDHSSSSWKTSPSPAELGVCGLGVLLTGRMMTTVTTTTRVRCASSTTTTTTGRRSNAAKVRERRRRERRRRRAGTGG